MLEPNRPISDYLDDLLHGVLSDEDAARVQEWLDTAPEAKAALGSAATSSGLQELPPSRRANDSSAAPWRELK